MLLETTQTEEVALNALELVKSSYEYTLECRMMLHHAANKLCI